MNEAAHVCINVTIRRERTDIPLHGGVGSMKHEASRTARRQVNPDMIPVEFNGRDTMAAELATELSRHATEWLMSRYGAD